MAKTNEIKKYYVALRKGKIGDVQRAFKGVNDKEVRAYKAGEEISLYEREAEEFLAMEWITTEKIIEEKPKK